MSIDDATVRPEELIQEGWWEYTILMRESKERICALMREIHQQMAQLVHSPWHLAARELIREATMPVDSQYREQKNLAQIASSLTTEECPTAIRLMSLELLWVENMLVSAQEAEGLTLARACMDDIDADPLAIVFARRTICNLSQDADEMLSCLDGARNHVSHNEYMRLLYATMRKLPVNRVCDLLEDIRENILIDEQEPPHRKAAVLCRGIRRLTEGMTTILKEEEEEGSSIEQPLAPFQRELDTRRYGELADDLYRILVTIPDAHHEQGLAAFCMGNTMLETDSFAEALEAFQEAEQFASHDTHEKGPQLRSWIQKQMQLCREHMNEPDEGSPPDDEDGLTGAL